MPFWRSSSEISVYTFRVILREECPSIAWVTLGSTPLSNILTAKVRRNVRTEKWERNVTLFSASGLSLYLLTMLIKVLFIQAIVKGM